MTDHPCLEVPFDEIEKWEKIQGSCARLYAAAEWGYKQALATPPPEAPPTPDLSALAAIGERLRTQDNRCTAHPAFQVRGLRRIYGMDLDYADESVWIENGSDCIEIDPPEDPENPGDFIIKTGYQDHWEIIMVAFSEQACLDYIKHNGHRHGVYRELEVYADSFYRCPEMLAIREALMAPPGESASPPEPPSEEDLLRLWQFNFGKTPKDRFMDIAHFVLALAATPPPEPPSLRKQAYDALDTYIYGEPDPKDKERTYNTIRQALEALPND